MSQRAGVSLVGAPPVASGTEAYDFGMVALETPVADAVLGKVVLPRAVTLAGDFAGARGHVDTAPDAEFILDVTRNGTAIGTVTIDTGGIGLRHHRRRCRRARRRGRHPLRRTRHRRCQHRGYRPHAAREPRLMPLLFTSLFPNAPGDPGDPPPAGPVVFETLFETFENSPFESGVGLTAQVDTYNPAAPSCRGTCPETMPMSRSSHGSGRTARANIASASWHEAAVDRWHRDRLDSATADPR